MGEEQERAKGVGLMEIHYTLSVDKKTKYKFRKNKGKFESRTVRASNWLVMKSPPLGLFVRVTPEVFDFAL